MWLDGRTSSIVDDLISKRGVQSANAVKQTSGLPLSTYFSSVKIRWLLLNVPAVKDALETGDCLVGTVDTWLMWVRCSLFNTTLIICLFLAGASQLK